MLQICLNKRKLVATMCACTGTICTILCSGVPATTASSASRITAAVYSGLQWRLIGPFRGGRVLAVAGVAGNPALFFFGAVDGGVWRTDDAGRTWNPIFDSEPVGSIGAIAIAPSNSNIIFVGSGEADMRSDISYGNGMYKSSDGGKTWRHIGLTDTRQIGRIVIDPRDPNRLFVAALGHAYAPNAARGVFRSTDGGSTWRKVLFLNRDTGAIDVAIDPSNSDHLLAAMWQTRRPPWNIYQPSNGPGTGLYESRNGGTTWRHLVGHGLPAEQLGRMGIAFAPSHPKRIYVIADARRGGLYRSDNSGASWRLVDADARLWDRGWYFCDISVDPKDANLVYVSDTALYRSTNGGQSFTAIKGSPDGDDFHQLWIDPTAPQRLLLGSDQGATVSLNFGRTWSSWFNQPTGQFYHVSTDAQFPFALYGAQQDSGAAMALSRSVYSSLTFRDWRAVAVGGENDMLVPDPQNPHLVYGGRVERYDLRTGQDQIIDPTLRYPGVQWRQTWTLPLAFSAADPRALYFGRQLLFRSLDGGQSWKIVSPDLTRPDPEIPPNLDATTIADNEGIGRRRGVIYTIAPSPLRRDEIWTGTDDGKIWITTDSGSRWHDVTPAALTPWSKVTMLEASWFDPKEAYAAIDRHRLDDLQPYIYRTRDAGRTWQRITSGIPRGSYLNAVRADPQRDGLVYAGTETGPYVSFDNGDRWLPLQLNLPNVSIRDFAVRGDSLAIATHGRSLWVLDDLTPLRQLSNDVVARDVWLFAPATTIRVRPGDDQAERLPPEEPAAKNPPAGAIIDYVLSAPSVGGLELEILDTQGHVVRRWSSIQPAQRLNPVEFPFISLYLPKTERPSAQPGLHQFIWDLRYAPAPGLPRGSREHQGPWAAPGRYTVRLIVSHRTFERPLELVKDPRIPASDADLRAQFNMAWNAEQEQALGLVAYTAARRAIAKLEKLQRQLTASCSSEDAIAVKQLAATVGAPPPISPDNSMGYPERDLTSLHSLIGELKRLEDALESADTAPTSDEQRAFEGLVTLLHTSMQHIPRTICGIEIQK